MVFAHFRFSCKNDFKIASDRLKSPKIAQDRAKMAPLPSWAAPRAANLNRPTKGGGTTTGVGTCMYSTERGL